MRRTVWTLGLGALAATLCVVARPGPSRSDTLEAAIARQSSVLRDVADRMLALEQAQRIHSVSRANELHGAVSRTVGETLAETPVGGAADGVGDAEAQAAQKNEADVPPTREQSGAFEEGSTLLDSALHATRWQATDHHELKHLMARMAPAQREELMTRLALAINRGEVRDETRDP